jgi:aryl-alcohol dehydrogenase-like predicted oxidoreductase
MCRPCEELTSDKLVRVQKLNQIARARGQSLAQMALARVLRHEAMTSALGSKSFSSGKNVISEQW